MPHNMDISCFCYFMLRSNLALGRLDKCVFDYEENGCCKGGISLFSERSFLIFDD